MGCGNHIGGISGAAASDGKYAFEQHKSPRRGLDGAISMCRDLGLSENKILEKLQEKYHL